MGLFVGENEYEFAKEIGFVRVHIFDKEFYLLEFFEQVVYLDGFHKLRPFITKKKKKLRFRFFIYFFIYFFFKIKIIRKVQVVLDYSVFPTSLQVRPLFH